MNLINLEIIVEKEKFKAGDISLELYSNKLWNFGFGYVDVKISNHETLNYTFEFCQTLKMSINIKIIAEKKKFKSVGLSGTLF